MCHLSESCTPYLGARPAEVTNVEITSAVLLALGHDSQEVETYRTRELTRAKGLVQSGCSVHIMDFEQIILNEVDYIDDHYSDTYTDTHRVYRYAETDYLLGVSNFTLLPADLQNLIMDYYGTFWAEINGHLEPNARRVQNLNIDYTRNYYYEATWIIDDPDDPPPTSNPSPTPTTDPESPSLDASSPNPGDSTLYSTTYFSAASATNGHWEYGPHIFTGGTYSGIIQFSGDGTFYSCVYVNVTASGHAVNSVDSISLNQIGAGGVYVTKQKVDGVWENVVVGRNPGRSGGLWTDPCVKADYERDGDWPAFPGMAVSSGSLRSGDGYLEVNSIPSNTINWHGPSFVRTLPSYFKISDMGSFAANLSLDSSSSSLLEGWVSVTLYDASRRPVVALVAKDNSAISNNIDVRVQYYLESGASKYHRVTVFKKFLGVVQVRYDPLQGVIASVPGASDKVLYLFTEVDRDRLVKYVVIQSYRYKSTSETIERIYNIRVSYAGSSYTVFHDNCNDMDEFHKDPAFPWGARSDGDLVVPSGQRYMTWESIATGSGWHGPVYTHVLERPFRLYQLSEFSVVGEMVQSSYTMGKAYVALFDENKRIVMLIHWGDAWVGATKGWFNVYFYPQDSSTGYQSSGYLYTSFKKTGKLWWGPYQGGEGAVYASIDGAGSSYPIAECDNASRVIKYVVILGYRYSSYSLVSMRIHDIAVVADLTRKNPTAPNPEEPVVVYDGSLSGNRLENDNVQAETMLTEANERLKMYWTGPWPELHFQYIPVNQDDSFRFHSKRDILDKTTLVEYHVEQFNKEETEDFFQEFVVQSLLIGGIFNSLMALSLVAWRYIEYTAGVGFASPAGAIALGLWIAAILYAYYAVETAAENYGQSDGWKAAIYAVLGFGCLIMAWGGYLTFYTVLTIVGLFASTALFAVYNGLKEECIGSILVRLVLTLTGFLFVLLALGLWFGW